MVPVGFRPDLISAWRTRPGSMTTGLADASVRHTGIAYSYAGVTDGLRLREESH